MHAAPERDGEWRAWLSEHPHFYPPSDTVLSQTFVVRDRRVKVDPNNCKHLIGRGMANRLRARLRARPKKARKGVIVPLPIICKLCGKYLTDPNDLDNQFLDPAGYIGTIDEYMDPEDDGAEVPRGKAPLPRSRVERPVRLIIPLNGHVAEEWSMPITKPLFDLPPGLDAEDLVAYGETSKEVRERLTVCYPVAIPFNPKRSTCNLSHSRCKYPLSHSHPTVRAITLAPTVDSIVREAGISGMGARRTRDKVWIGEPGSLARDHVEGCISWIPRSMAWRHDESVVLHHIRSIWMIRMFLGLEGPQPSPYPLVICPDRDGNCLHVKCILWRKARCVRHFKGGGIIKRARCLHGRDCPGFIISKHPAVEIDARRFLSSGDIACALRLTQRIVLVSERRVFDDWTFVYTVREIAEKTGMSVPTVERRLRAAGLTEHCPLDSPVDENESVEGQQKAIAARASG